MFLSVKIDLSDVKVLLLFNLNDFFDLAKLL